MTRPRPSLGTLLHHVHVSGPLSRAALAERMGVNRSTILALTAVLVASGLVTAARVGLGGAVLDRLSAPRVRTGVDLEHVVRKLASLGRTLLGSAPPGSRCAGVGASYCGMIRPGDGRVRYGPEMGWVDQAFFGGMLRDVFSAAAPQVAARIGRHAMPVSRERARLRVSALAGDATLLGAADLGFTALLARPG